MLTAILLMAQSAIAEPTPIPVASPNLPKTLRVTTKCVPADDDVVVCGNIDPDLYRIRPLGPPPNGKSFPPMTMRLGDGVADLHAEQRCITKDLCAPALMATIKLPF